jgi:hypothetical protein
MMSDMCNRLLQSKIYYQLPQPEHIQITFECIISTCVSTTNFACKVPGKT